MSDTAAHLGLLSPKNVPSKFLLKTESIDFVEGIQSNKSIGYSLKFFFTFIQNSLPMKIFPIENFKIAVESSQIAHSIGNFILKNIKTGHFLIKSICEEIWRNNNKKQCTVAFLKLCYISSHVTFIKKCAVLKFFSIKFPIEWAICELSTPILK